ncbi:MAG: hypothetical protein E6G44_07745 [Actinobacteria bacterium]|nr:MAG: hypothetical protein E6G44_07745 [Actinomycetota bacterium]
MRRSIVVRLLGLAMLTASAVGGSVAAAGPALASAPCADLSLSASPAVVHPGEPETVSGSITNCSDQTETVKLRVHVTGPCNIDARDAFKLTLEPGQTLERSVTFPAPDCLGTYTVRAKAVSGGVVLDKAKASFEVVA